MSIYISAVTDIISRNEEKLKNIENLFNYTKRNEILDSNKYRILIKNRNLNYTDKKQFR